MGARVIATVGSDAEIGSATELGAECVANFRDTDYCDTLAAYTGHASIDRVVDVAFGDNFAQYLPLLKDNAVIAGYAAGRRTRPEIAFYDLMFRNIFVHPILVYSMPDTAKRAAKRDINQMLESGVIQHRISHSLPLENIVAAHELIESGCQGSVVVTMDS